MIELSAKQKYVLRHYFRIIATTSALIISGCSNKEDIELLSNKFKECVSSAETKHEIAVVSLCKSNLDYKGATRCHYPTASKDTLDRSMDNEISACALMYSPKK